MTASSPHIILCNGATRPSTADGTELRLEYRERTNHARNITIELPRLVQAVLTLPSRVLDLIELASYIYCADRHTSRGESSAVEYHAWSRRFTFAIRVRDVDFWRSSQVRLALAELLTFLTGDAAYNFDFQGGHRTNAQGLFDSGEKGAAAPRKATEVLLFSGGLDSLSGAVTHLSATTDNVCLVSHGSAQPSTTKTQDALVAALQQRYPRRVRHSRFKCHLRGYRADEESQRSRFFLYSAIAFAFSTASKRRSFTAFENGITSLNFPRRQDAMLARSSRTTHPRTIALLETLFSLVDEQPFTVATPFQWKTKGDVVAALDQAGGRDLVSSTVSCTKTFKLKHGRTHCGCCLQCIDRRFAIYSQRVAPADNSSLYDKGLSDPLQGEEKTAFVDYLRQVVTNGDLAIDGFYKDLANELAEVTPYVKGKDEQQAVTQVHDLFKRHRLQVLAGMKEMQGESDLTAPVVQDSILGLIGDRTYLRTPVALLVENLSVRLRRGIPLTFKHNRPKREHNLNDCIQALLDDGKQQIEREYPGIRYAISTAVPDHSMSEYHLLLEAKYIRGRRTPSQMTEEIAADITKFKRAGHTLFVVYDPESRIADRAKFCEIQDGENCTVQIVP